MRSFKEAFEYAARENCLNVGTRPELKKCTKCGYEFFIYHTPDECQSTLKKSENNVDKNKQKLDAEKEKARQKGNRK